VVAGEADPQRFGDGHLPVFTALGVTDLQHPGAGVDIVWAQQASFAGPQTTGVDRAEQYRHDQVAEWNPGTVAAPVSLGEQPRQFLVGVDVGDVAGRPGQHPCGQDVGPDAAPAQPSGQFPDRRGQALQGRRFDASSPGGGDPRLDRDLSERVQAGEPGAAERFEPGQHPFFGGVLVADGAFLRDKGCDRVGQRDL
jgi:hypothetical protein